MRSRKLFGAAGAVVLAGALAAGGSTPAAAQATAMATPVASGFDWPIYATAPKNDTRVFVVERGGTVRIVKNGMLLSTPFIDLSPIVSQDRVGEGGLLSIAFPPD